MSLFKQVDHEQMHYEALVLGGYEVLVSRLNPQYTLVIHRETGRIFQVRDNFTDSDEVNAYEIVHKILDWSKQ